MSQEDIQVEMREIRRQMRLVSGLEDAKQGIPPAHSGLQRDPVSDEVRDLTKQIHDAMRESGIDKQRTPEERWKSALDSAKTRLKNEIKDILNDMKRRGIANVLALRGDAPKDNPDWTPGPHSDSDRSWSTA